MPLAALALVIACACAAPPAAWALSKVKLTASFVVEPTRPVTGQAVRFGSTSMVTSGVAAIVRHEWDLDGDGTFETDTGAVPAAARVYPSPGRINVALRVTDSRDKQAVASQVLVVRSPGQDPPPPANRPPSASFIFSPTAPAPGQTITFASTSSDPENAIAQSSWDLNGDGLFGDALGPVATSAFPAAGSRTVSLRVTDARGATSFYTQTVTITTVAGGAPVQTQRQTPAVISLMNPFPVVRMAGHYNSRGVQIRLFTISAPSGAKVTARCSGHGCPFRRKLVTPRRSQARAAKLLHVRPLERRLPAGVRLVITVTKPGQIGKYTLFKVRSRRPPTRVDRCLVPGSSRPRRCNTLSFLP